MSVSAPIRAKLEQVKGKATIEIIGSVDKCWGFSTSELVYQLRELENVDEIGVVIHSDGGSIVEGYAIYTMLAQHRAKIIVDIIGLAASSASVIAMAGDVIRISDVGYLMMHKPWLCSCGNADVLRADADLLDKMLPGIVRAYQRHTKKTEKELIEWMQEGDGAGKWFTAEDALAAGLVTEVYSAPALRNALDMTGLRGAPQAAVDRFTKPVLDQVPEPEPQKPEEFFAQVLAELGHSPESAQVVAEVLAHLDERAEVTNADKRDREAEAALLAEIADNLENK